MQPEPLTGRVPTLRTATAASVLTEHESEDRVEPRQRATTRFIARVSVIVAISFLARVAWVVWNRHVSAATDAFFYVTNAQWIAQGRGVLSGFGRAPSAFHPPAWPAVLSVADLLGFSTIFSHQLFACVVGAVTLVLVALAGREIGGERVGLIAVIIAALYPNIWMWERELAAETLVVALTAAVILVAYRFVANPRSITIAALGALCGVLAMTRGEQALLLVALVIPLVIMRVRTKPRRAVRLVAIACAAMAIVMAPWIIYNTSRFDRRVLIATDFGPTVYLSNDDVTYHGAWIGGQDVARWGKALPGQGGDESVVDAASLHEGITYARHHLSRLPLVVAAREGRTWNAFAVFQQSHMEAGWGKDSIWLYRAGILTYWLLLPAAIAGGVILRRRRTPLLPLLAPFVVATVATAIAFGSPRYRACAEVPLVLLAAVAVDAALSRRPRNA